MKFTFDKYFSRFVDGRTEFVVEEEVFGVAINKLLDTFPQLYVNLMDNDAKVAQESILTLNEDEVLSGFDEIKRTVSSTDVVHLSRELPQGEGGIIQVIVGIVEIIVGAVLVLTGVGVGFGVWLIYGGIVSVLGGIVTAILTQMMTPDAPPIPAGIGSSATYTFDGIQNTTASGTPIPIIYGEHRVGGHVLNLYTEPDAGVPVDSGVLVQQTFLFAQIGIGEGPIEAVSDLNINGYPEYFYNAVTSFPDPDYFRLGEETQSVMPPFGRVENTTTLNQKVFNTNVAVTPGRQTYSEYLPIQGVVAGGRNGLGAPSLQLGPYTQIVV